jgi:hypothetical protein
MAAMLLEGNGVLQQRAIHHRTVNKQNFNSRLLAIPAMP